MQSRYLDMVRQDQRRRNRPRWEPSARGMLLVLGILAMVLAFAWHFSIQSQLTNNIPVALAFSLILAMGGPSLASFLMPFSPAGMLLQKIQARTWGMGAVAICCLFILYYGIELGFSFWATQQGTLEAGLVWHQIGIGIVGFFVVPALLFAPVTNEELVEQVRQAHLVKRYELQTAADIAILRATLLQAQRKALIGFLNLTVQERAELAGVMRGLVKNIDYDLKQIGGQVEALADTAGRFGSLPDGDDIRGYLDFEAETLKQGLLPAPRPEPEPAPEYEPEPARSRSSYR